MCSFWSLTVDSVVTGLHLVSDSSPLSLVSGDAATTNQIQWWSWWDLTRQKKMVSVGGAAENIGGQGKYRLQWWCCRTGQPPKKLWCGKVGEGRGRLSLKEENAC
ncbi:hypothetical protein Bca4012_057152 [Brassica carinata]